MEREITLGGVDVPRIGMGTNRLRPSNAGFVQEAVAAGVRFIDTAHLYSGGESEATIGEAGVAGECVVATKGGYQPGEGRPDVLREQIEESLAAIAEYRDQGKIRDIGISNVSVEQVERAREVVPVAAVQNHYSLADRQHEDVVDYCTAEGIVFVPYFPLRGVESRELDEVAERHGATAAQIALAWLLHRSPVTLPIPGTLSLEHARANLAALEIELTDEELERLER